VSEIASVRGLDRAHRLAFGLIAGVLLVAAAARLMAASGLPFQADEPHSLLAAHMAAERGIPLLPSGVLYLHGATLSYLLAPLVWLGQADIEQLRTLRIVSVVLGVVTVFLTFLLGRLVTRSIWGGILAAALMMLDPWSVLWSSRVRMYSVEQTLVVAMVLFVAIALTAALHSSPSQGGRHLGLLIAMVAAAWLAVFAHLGAALVLPGLGLAALLLLRRRLLLDQRPLLVALAAMCLAPVAVVGLTSLIGKGSSTTGTGDDELLPQASFLGDHHLDPNNLIHAPDLRAWMDLMALGRLGEWSILVVVAASIALVVYLVYSVPRGHLSGLNQPALIVTLMAYWVPVLIVAIATVQAHSRYLIYLQPLGYVLVATVGVLLVGVARRQGTAARLAVGATALFGLLTLAIVVDQAIAIRSFPERVELYGPNHASAYEYVAVHRQPGELIISSGPPEAYLVLGSAPELRYLAGEEDSSRMVRTLREDDQGRIVDYWAGMEAIQTVEDLCAVLADDKRAWAVVDSGMTREAWRKVERRGKMKSLGPMREVLEGATSEELVTSEGIFVLRALDIAEWSRPAQRECRERLSS
jgi:hypothetical protein